jgi:hypothetical protein
MKSLRAWLLFASLLPACSARPSGDDSAAPSKLEALSVDEALGDLDVLASTIRREYGALSYKKARFGFDLDAEVAIAKAKIQAGQTEGDRVRPFYELLAKLRDGHIGLAYRLRGDDTSEWSLTDTFVTPIGGAYYLSAAPTTSGLQVGDKLVSIDGIAAERLEAALSPLIQTGTPECTRHKLGLQMTQRPFYVPAELQPTGPTAKVVVEHADGTSFTTDVAWVAKTGMAGQVVVPTPSDTASEPPMLSPHLAYLVATLQQRAQSTPIWLTQKVRDTFGVVDVTPQTATLSEFGVYTSPAIPEATTAMRFPNRAYKYGFNGKTVLVVRVPTFNLPLQNADENVAWVAAVLANDKAADRAATTLAEKPADVVVIDVSHNPGGSVPYTQGLAGLFITSPVPNIVQETRASRRQLSSLLTSVSNGDAVGRAIWQKRYDDTEAAYDRGDELAPFAAMSGQFLGPKFPFVGVQQSGDNMLPPHPTVRCEKPLLVLHDELSGSGGDAFPTILQNAGVAKTFGARTAGAGGAVMSVQLPYSGAVFSFPVGLFGAYDAEPARVRLVENNGVTPDFPHAVSIDDFRGGYVDYSTAFSQIATSLPNRAR